MEREIREYRLLMVSSSGGVLLDLLALKPWWQQHHVTWVLVEAEDTYSLFQKAQVYWLQECKANTPFRLLQYFIKAIHVIRKHRPHLIISSGTGVAIPFFMAAKLLKVPSLWLETLNIIDTPGVASRICASIASEVLVQRLSLKKVYPHATVIGELY